MNLLAEVPSALPTAWENFYVIIGSSGGALIGLQFVVITLIADSRRRGSLESINAFGTPTVVHFVGALTISALLSAPWPALWPPSVALALYGLGSLIYTAIIFRRARRQKDYTPVFEDWLWHVILPTLAYFALALAALLLSFLAELALFIIAAVALGLLLIGIHNAWDTVTYLAADNTKESP